MAEFGANHPCFKPKNSTAGVVLDKLVSANLTVNLASGELYADDSLAEQLSEFASGTIAMETDHMSDANAAIVYGCKVEDGTVIYNTNDTAPEGELTYYKVLMKNGVKSFKGYYYPRVRAALGNDNAQTRGSNITFQTTQTTFTVFADDAKDWRKTKTFATPEAAIAWCDTMCSVATYHAINVSSQGAGESEGVQPLGISYVVSGEDFALAIEGADGIVAAYDNGIDVTTAIQGGGGTYTLSAVATDHDIVIIF